MLIDPAATLKPIINAFGAMDDVAYTAFVAPWTMVKAKRKQLLTTMGDAEQYLYYVLDGVQRAYTIHGDREATLVFSYTGSFSGVIDSFFLQQPSAYYLEAITHSTMLRIRYSDMVALMEQHRAIETWVRIAITRVLADTLKRHTELLTFSVEEKFTTLLHRSPHILNLIPHKYLASYIGVDPTNFSKMLGKVRL